MGPEAYDKLWKLIGLRYASHPWHGVEIGTRAPEVLTSFIEVIPSDTVKYEIDKKSGFLKIDRPAEVLQYRSGTVRLRSSDLLYG